MVRSCLVGTKFCPKEPRPARVRESSNCRLRGPHLRISSSCPGPRIEWSVIAAGEDEGKRRMHGDAPNIVWKGFKYDDLVVRVVVEYSKLEMVWPRGSIA